MLTPVETAALIAETANGDVGAFERLYAQTSAKLYGVVLRILRRHDLAAAVIEQVYLEIWRKAAEFDAAQSAPITWMVAMARRRAIDLARAPTSAAGEGEPEIEDAETPGALPRRELTDDLKGLLTCIGRLEPDRQRMILLAYYGAFGRDQLAAKLARSPEDISTALRRSLSEIAQCLSS